MAKIAGINLPLGKRIEAALTAIYGIGLATSDKILVKAQINPDARTKDLRSADIEKLRQIIEKEYRVEGDLRTLVAQNIRRLKEISSYRGLRHSKSLPVRGQRTKTNARTKRGKKITVGSGRKKAAEKT